MRKRILWMWIATLSMAAAKSGGKRLEGHSKHAKPPAPPPATCTCPAIFISNFCVTLNGQSEILDSLLVVRVRGALEDTMGFPRPDRGNCFGAATGNMNVRVYQRGKLVRETAPIQVRSEDCCNAESKQVDIALPFEVHPDTAILNRLKRTFFPAKKQDTATPKRLVMYYSGPEHIGERYILDEDSITHENYRKRESHAWKAPSLFRAIQAAFRTIPKGQYRYPEEWGAVLAELDFSIEDQDRSDSYIVCSQCHLVEGPGVAEVLRLAELIHAQF